MSTMERKPLFSIITVVFNDAANLEKTIKSVIEQECSDYEFILIDGGSTDGTLEVIKKYEAHISSWVSERDKGIYDAMNKGISKARGCFVNFLNAGDLFYNKQVLSKLAAHAGASQRPVDVLYGKALHKSSDQDKVSYVKGSRITAAALFKNVPFCHQALFVKRELFYEVGHYNTAYKVVADYEWLIRYYNLTLTTDKLHFIDEIVVEYDRGGYSFKNIQKGVLEKFSIVQTSFKGKHYLKGNIYFGIDYFRVLVVVCLYKLGVIEQYRKLKYSVFQKRELKLEE